MADVLDQLEVELRRAERDAARDESARLQAVIDEVRSTLAAGGDPANTLAWLRERLG